MLNERILKERIQSLLYKDSFYNFLRDSSFLILISLSEVYS